MTPLNGAAAAEPSPQVEPDVPAVVNRKKDQKIADKALAALLLEAQKEAPMNDVVRLRDAEIAEVMCVSRRSVQRALAALVKRGQVTIKTQRRRGPSGFWYSNRKILLHPARPSETAGSCH